MTATSLTLADLIVNNDPLPQDLFDFQYLTQKEDHRSFDTLEYAMGEQRGWLDSVPRSLETPYFRYHWAIIPDDEVLHVLENVLSTPGKRWDSENHLSIKTPDGNECEPGVTRIHSTLHPCLTIGAGTRFLARWKSKPPHWQALMRLVRNAHVPLIVDLPLSWLLTNPYIKRTGGYCYDDRPRESSAPQSELAQSMGKLTMEYK
ncbi:hypothetical protein H0H93_010208 [Arthromyces matolae]|nr:hypothetical protein H0H93_010208 [Arthromyces matolae]